VEDLNRMEKALITGITGQDGSYLTEFMNHHEEVSDL
jgi:GDP-D-mannose dehydratase